ncbi:helix-turn-helix domain-containing protein [Actinacidiphila glaucinigra]|uniref:helix-turn-helix domain-containing protein n=1 Tax=Actinacidiphila glaucinigra TaxID=235986 RepID=UPI000B792073
MGTGRGAGDFHRVREQRRLTAGQLFEQGGRSDAEIARMPGVSAQAVHNWHHPWNQGGRRPCSGTGSPARSAPWTRTRLRDLLS